jgi:3-dehydrosphinganine reductase
MVSVRLCDTHAAGLSKGHYQITNDLITDLVRLQSKGAVPANNVAMDFLYWVIGGVSPEAIQAH